MTSATEFQFWQTIGIAVGVISGIGATIYGIFRKVYCKGIGDNNQENRIKFLEDANTKVVSELETLKQDILNYRSKTEGRLDEIRDNQALMKTDIEVTKTNIQAIKETLDRAFPTQ